MHVDTFGEGSALLDDSTSRLRALDAVPRRIADLPRPCDLAISQSPYTLQ